MNNENEHGKKIDYILNIPVAQIRVDDSYQRDPVKTARIIEMAEHWSDAKAAVIIVSQHDGDGGQSYYNVIDGQERVIAAKYRGKPLSLLAGIFEGLTAQDEADLFLAYNADRTLVMPKYLYKARLVAHDEISVRVRAICEAHGLSLEVDGKVSVSNICCVNTLRELEKKGLLDSVLTEVRAIWPHEADAHSAPLLLGMGWILELYPDLYRANRADLHRKLSGVTAREIMAQGHMYRGLTRGTNVGRALLYEINKGRSTKRWPDVFDTLRIRRYPVRASRNIRKRVQTIGNELRQ